MYYCMSVCNITFVTSLNLKHGFALNFVIYTIHRHKVPFILHIILFTATFSDTMEHYDIHVQINYSIHTVMF